MKNQAKAVADNGQMGFILFIAYIGAAVYFVEQANGFWEVIVALLKAIVWPGFVLYHALGMLGA